MNEKKAFPLFMPISLKQAIVQESRQRSDIAKRRISVNQVINSYLEDILADTSFNELVKRDYYPNELKNETSKNQTIYLQLDMYAKLNELTMEIFKNTGKKITLSAIINTFLKEKYKMF